MAAGSRLVILEMNSSGTQRESSRTEITGQRSEFRRTDAGVGVTGGEVLDRRGLRFKFKSVSEKYVGDKFKPRIPDCGTNQEF